MARQRHWQTTAVCAALSVCAFLVGGVGAIGAALAQDAAAAQEQTVSAAPQPLRVYEPGENDHEGTWRPLTAQTALPERIVLLVHGLDEPGGIWDDLAPALAQAGHAVVRFEYPNDQGIAASARLLRKAMIKLLHARNPGFDPAQGLGLRAEHTLRVDIVAHSMGGLVAREYLTMPPPKLHVQCGNDPAAGNDWIHKACLRVDRLVMVGTPNKGSALAPLRCVAEWREHLARLWDTNGAHDPFTAMQADGAGEAGVDLTPGSDFLEELNARPLPMGVEITCVVGKVASFDVDALRDAANAPLGRRLLANAGLDAQEVVAALDDLADQVGDGVVPVASATLEGVDDVVTLEENHRSMLRRTSIERTVREWLDLGEPAPAPAIEVILDRLATPSKGEGWAPSTR